NEPGAGAAAILFAGPEHERVRLLGLEFATIRERGISMIGRQFCGRTRREFLWEVGAGFGSVALTGLLSADGFFNRAAATEKFVNPLAPKKPMAPAKA